MDTRDASRSIELMPLPLSPARLGAAPPLAAVGSSLSGRVLLRGIQRHWWLVLVLWGIGSAAAIGFIYVKFEPSYEAISLLKVNSVVSDPFNRHMAGSGRDASFLETQVQLITSTNVLLAAAGKPEIAGFPMIQQSLDVVAMLRDALDVRIVPNSNLIQVTMSSSSSQEAAGIVNAVVDAYLEADEEWSANINRQQIDRLTEFSKQLKAQVAEKQKALLDLAARGNFEPTVPVNLAAVAGRSDEPAVTTQQSVTIEEYGRIRQQLVTVNIDLVAAEANLEARRREHSRSTPVSPTNVQQQLEAQLRQDGDLASLRMQIEEIDQRIASVKRVSRRPKSEPAVKLLESKKQTLIDRYHQLLDEKLAQLRQNLPAITEVDNRELEAATAKVDTLQATKERLESMLEQLDVINRQQGTDAVQAAFIQSDLDQIRGMLAVVEQRQEALRYEARGQSQITLIDKAMPAKAPIQDKRPKLLAVAPFLVLFSVLGAFSVLEVRSRRVDCPDDLSRRAQAEVFAIPQLPQLQLAAGGGLLARRRSPGEVIEEFAHRIDHMRVALCGGSTDTGWGRCVMITSAVSGEGKTTLSAQLGARCADSGLTTVLIDADLRQASLGRVFDLAEAPGLSEVLEGRAALEEVLIDLPQIGGCKLLAAGAPMANPGRLFQGPRLRATIERLRQSFDVVIIDTPPILPVPDGLILGRWSDGAVLATRHDESRLPLLERAQHLLRNAGLPLLGIAINGVRRAPAAGYANYAYLYRSSHRSSPTEDA